MCWCEACRSAATSSWSLSHRLLCGSHSRRSCTDFSSAHKSRTAATEIHPKHLEKKQLILITVRLKTATGRETHKFKISLITFEYTLENIYIIDLN